MNTIVKNFLSLAFGRYLAIGIGSIVNILIARTLGLVDYGSWGVAIAASMLFAGFIDLGLNKILVKEGSAARDRVGGHLFNILLVKGLLTVIILGAVHLYAVREGWLSPMYKLILLLSICKMADNFNQTFDRIFQIFQRMEISAMILVGGRLFLLAAVLKGWADGATLLYFAWVYLFVSLGTSLATLVISNRKFARPESGTVHWKETVGREGLYFAISSVIFLSVVNMPIIVLREWVSKEVVGYFSSLVMVMNVFNTLPLLVETSILPVIFDLGRNARHKLGLFYSDYMNRSLIIVQFPYLWATFFPESLAGLFGSEFLPAAPWLRLLVPVLILRFINLAAGNVLTALDKQWLRTICSGLWGVSILALLFILVPRYGILGAVIASLAGDLLVTVLLVALVAGHGYRIRWQALSRTIISGVLAAALLLLIARTLPAGVTSTIPGVGLSLGITFLVVASCLLLVRATSFGEMRGLLRPGHS